MDTKLKNINEQELNQQGFNGRGGFIKNSKAVRITAFILIWLSILGSFGCMIFLVDNDEIFNYETYFDTYKFEKEYQRYIHNVVEYYVKLASEEKIKASGEDQKVIANNLSRYEIIKGRLKNNVNFLYYIRNTETGDIITNIDDSEPLSFMENQNKFVYINQYKNYNDNDNPYIYIQDNAILIELAYDITLTDAAKMLSGTPYEVYTAVAKPLKEGDVFYTDYQEFSRIKTISTYIKILLYAFIIIIIADFIYLVYVNVRRNNGKDVVQAFSDRIYTDVYTLLVFIAAIISLAILANIDFYHYHGIVTYIVVYVILSIDIFIGLFYVLSMIRQLKNARIFKNTLTYKIYRTLKLYVQICFEDRSFKISILFLLLIYGGANAILFSILVFSIYGGLNYGNEVVAALFSFSALAGLNIAAVYYLSKTLVVLAQIMQAAREISSGNLEYELDISKMSVTFLRFAENILSIQSGLKKAVDEAVRGERMKTDLIANVSHDLKTPLTSIVNYVDLLKKEKLQNEKANEYINILDEKSARLKQLIEDLIEASKASSGNLPVKTEKIDLYELVQQACGEFEEKINKAGLELRANSVKKNVFIKADGKHMWRIFENLFSNVIKYSMPKSRVYINIDVNDKFGVFIIKNISAFPLNIPPEQLTERFVRGDASRTTEGSGLGLSIAQSLTGLQGGRFTIDIDGDLFKVVVEMPLWK